jgi:hypothetical protein
MRRRTTIRFHVTLFKCGGKETVRYSLVGVTSISDNGPATTTTMPKTNNAEMAVRTNKPLKIAVHWLSPLRHKGSVGLGRMGGWKEGLCLREYLFPEPSSNGDSKAVPPWWNTCSGKHITTAGAPAASQNIGTMEQSAVTSIDYLEHFRDEQASQE